MPSIRDAFTKSFLERNQKVIGVIGVALVLTGTVLALLLQGGLLTPTYTVKAYFSDAAGIRPGDRVTVAGLEVGKVKSVDIEHGKVAMELGVRSGTELSRDTSADIIIETLLGRRSVDLVTGHDNRPLEDGDVIPLSRTETPIDITKLNDISVKLLDKSNAAAFNDFLDEISKVTRNKEGQVRTLITGLTQVSEAINARQAQLRHLLDSLRTVATTLGERDNRIVSLIDNLNPVLADLAARQKDIATLLVATDSASHETAGLVKRNRSVLDATLAALHRDLNVIDAHQLDLAASISYLEQAVQGYQSVGYSAGHFPNRWANIFVQSLGPAGVDDLLGQCGTVDQFFDHYFGTNCAHHGSTSSAPLFRATVAEIGSSQSSSGGTGVTGQLPLPKKVRDISLPCSVDDLFNSVMSTQPQECLP